VEKHRHRKNILFRASWPADREEKKKRKRKEKEKEKKEIFYFGDILFLAGA
jgi:hypothetical protein